MNFLVFNAQISSYFDLIRDFESVNYQQKKMSAHGLVAMNTVLLIVGVLLPPLGFVFVMGKETEKTYDFNNSYLQMGLNLLLTICLWLPGVIHFLYYWYKQGGFYRSN